MTSVLAAFMVAVGGTALIYYVVVNRVPNRKVRSPSAGSDGLSIVPVDNSSGESLNLLSWFSSNNSASDSSSCSGESSSADSSACSSDSSGGGGGGGDGGSGD